MSKTIVRNLKLISKTTILFETDDKFTKLGINIPANTEISKYGMSIFNQSVPLKSTDRDEIKKMKLTIYLETLIYFKCNQIISSIKNEPLKFMECCKYKGGDFDYPFDILDKTINCQFIIHDKYQSSIGNDTAYDKFKSIHNLYPNFTKWSKINTDTTFLVKAEFDTIIPKKDNTIFNWTPETNPLINSKIKTKP